MEKINKYIDHTILKQNTLSGSVERVCAEAIEYDFASVCIPPTYVPITAELLKNSSVDVCTVIGFPLGYSDTQVKLKESEIALKQGCRELDMVINQTHIQNEDYGIVEAEIKKLAEIAHEGNALLKVIIETCLLTKGQKIMCCKLVSNAGADYIKTSTGFSTGGATIADIELMKENVSENVKIKASGGIKTLEFARQLIRAGASRIGTSSGVQIMEDSIE
jgi:deoxyribose-phosphate aldolase